MKCTLAGLNLRIFGRAVQSLAKIGEELYIETDADWFDLRSTNLARSAYARFHFTSAFFVRYRPPSIGSESQSRCKIPMKSALMLFKSVQSIEKSVESLKINLDYQNSKLIFQLECKFGIIKRYNFNFIDSEPLEALYVKDNFKFCIVALSKVFVDATNAFLGQQEEITLVTNQSTNQISLKNYIDDMPDPSKAVRTVYQMESNDFSQVRAGTTMELTFCLKEFKAVVGFAELLGLHVGIHFDAPGQPIIFSVEGLGYCCDFVLATLMDDATSTQSLPANTLQARLQFDVGSPANQIIASDNSTQDRAEVNGKRNSIRIPGSSGSNNGLEDGDGDGDVVPVSPPVKIFRSIFLGLSQVSRSSTSSSESQQNGRIDKLSSVKKPNLLVGDSDEDD